MNNAIKRQQLAPQVIDYLKGAIASGAYRIGTKLPPEPRLMKELGVGRSTLREAVRALAHSGLLEVRQGDGTYVRSLPSGGEPLAERLKRAKADEVQEVRRNLELQVVRLAAGRHKKSDLTRARGFLKLRREALAQNSMSAALDADIAFHCALAEATGNPVLSDLYRVFALTLREALATLWDAGDGSPSEAAGLHDKLVDAIAARDAAQAEDIAAALLDRHGTTLAEAGKNEPNELETERE